MVVSERKSVQVVVVCLEGKKRKGRKRSRGLFGLGSTLSLKSKGKVTTALGLGTLGLIGSVLGYYVTKKGVKMVAQKVPLAQNPIVQVGAGVVGGGPLVAAADYFTGGMIEQTIDGFVGPIAGGATNGSAIQSYR